MWVISHHVEFVGCRSETQLQVGGGGGDEKSLT